MRNTDEVESQPKKKKKGTAMGLNAMTIVMKKLVGVRKMKSTNSRRSHTRIMIRMEEDQPEAVSNSSNSCKALVMHSSNICTLREDIFSSRNCGQL